MSQQPRPSRCSIMSSSEDAPISPKPDSLPRENTSLLKESLEAAALACDAASWLARNGGAVDDKKNGQNRGKKALSGISTTNHRFGLRLPSYFFLIGKFLLLLCFIRVLRDAAARCPVPCYVQHIARGHIKRGCFWPEKDTAKKCPENPPPPKTKNNLGTIPHPTFTDLKPSIA